MKEVQYIVDNHGNRTAAIVPFLEWETLTDKYHKLQNKVNVLLDIRDSLHEIRQAKLTGESLQTLDAFLHESRD